MIVQSGALNTTALVVPGVYVQIQVPTPLNLNGVPSNVLGIVGTASWGPVNSPAIVGSLAQAVGLFGPVQARKYDLLTHVAIAAQQGAANFRLVRVTDGTDVAASIAVLTNCITFTSKYSGTFGNSIQVTISVGSQAGTFKAVVAAPGLVSEAFDNIGLGLSGNPLWVAIATAINNGNTALRGPSQIITAAAGAGATAPASATYSLASGTDGATTITGSVLIGADTTPRTGMYALRNTGASVVDLADCDTSSTWTTQVAFGLSEGAYMIMTGPAGDTIANAISTKASAGVDSYGGKLLFGDWVYWLDTYNNQQRLVSPQAFVAGLLSNLSPQNSSLNKPIQGIAGTQKSIAQQQYVNAELQSLIVAGIDVIANPSPGGTYFATQCGHNSSSNPLTNNDAYTRLINYIAATLNAGMGIFIGKVINATLLADVQAVLSNFLETMQGQGQIGSPNGGIPYSVQVNPVNNPQARTALGYVQADVQVQFLGIAEKLLVNLMGGASVQISRVAA